MIAVIRSRDVGYPEAGHAFSPGEAYPEYAYRDSLGPENRVYDMVRTLFVQAGLDRDHLGSPAWNPLGRWIRPGARVFVLCNFVCHRRPSESERDLHAKVTHGSVLRALIDYVLIATGRSGRVLFGNAPLQSCRWEDVLADSGAAEVRDFYRRVGAPVEAIDLRGEVTERDALGRVRRRDVREESTPVVDFDLGSRSLLDAAGSRQHYRVADYNPDRTEGFHRPGSHRYLMHRAVIDSDVVISLPKLKTHEKVGVTCVVKGFVGAVVRKDCLAHHRFGSPAAGGDEYPARFAMLAPLSRFHDWVNRRADTAPGQAASQVLDRSARRILRRVGVTGAGAWHGNDTAWRMAVDLARILHYGGGDGTLHPEVRRRHLALIDGIVAGEGNGPLAPTAVDARALIFADGVVEADRAACRLMGFDPADVPMVREASSDPRWPLDPPTGPSPFVLDDGVETPPDGLSSALGRPFRPPRGWRGYLGRIA